MQKTTAAYVLVIMKVEERHTVGVVTEAEEEAEAEGKHGGRRRNIGAISNIVGFCSSAVTVEFCTSSSSIMLVISSVMFFFFFVAISI